MVHVNIYYQSWTDITGKGSSSSISTYYIFCRFSGNGCLKSCLLSVTSFAQSNTDRIFSVFNVFLTDVPLKSAGLKCLEHTTVSVVFYLIGNHLEYIFIFKSQNLYFRATSSWQVPIFTSTLLRHFINTLNYKRKMT